MSYDFDATPTMVLSQRTVSADTTLNDTDGVVFVTPGASQKTMTLPKAADVTDQVITIVKADSTTSAVIVDGDGSELVGANASISLRSLDDWIQVVSNGTSWDIVDVNIGWRSVSATNSVTTTGTDSDVPNMLISTPGKGRHRIVFSCNGRSQQSNKDIEIVIMTQAGFTIVKAEESRRSHGGNSFSGMEASCEMTITDDSADVKAGFTALGGGTAEIESRVLAVKFLGQ